MVEARRAERARERGVPGRAVRMAEMRAMGTAGGLVGVKRAAEEVKALEDKGEDEEERMTRGRGQDRVMIDIMVTTAIDDGDEVTKGNRRLID